LKDVIVLEDGTGTYCSAKPKIVEIGGTSYVNEQECPDIETLRRENVHQARRVGGGMQEKKF
jgi:hypothetical protein